MCFRRIKDLKRPSILNFYFLTIFYSSLVSCNPKTAQPDFYPHSFDDRISIQLVASSPEIVTPIGITIDKLDRVYFLESHTHTPQNDYPGPKYDRIKIGIDSNDDSIPDSWQVYADSISDGMNLFSGPNNEIFLTTKNGVFSYSDTDQDGVSDVKKTLLKMPEPENVYDHAGILGLTIKENWIYISRGNTGGLKWRIIGSDGSELNGYGDGGNVIRCKLDGSQLEEVATGFWNPFDLKFDHFGKLMLIDNDPDSRGPNRLIEIVKGGDYGYQSLYGGSGIHPFLAWNGELPGTLPFSMGLGEAPSGIVDAAFANFPDEYGNSLLVSIWEENSIVSVPLIPGENRIYGEPKVLFKGGNDFHPVAFATNSKGDVFFTDWVKREYPNHGLGRIWKISGNQNNNSRVIDDFSGKGFLQRIDELGNEEEMINQLSYGDPFDQAVARDQLAKVISKEKLISMLEDQNQMLRLQALLILKRTNFDISAAILKSLLNQGDPDLLRMTLIYIASKGREDLKDELESLLRKNQIPPNLFPTYLATISHLDPEYIQKYVSQEEPYSRGLKRNLPKDYVLNLIKDPSIPIAIKNIAIPFIDQPSQHIPELIELFQNESMQVKAGLVKIFKRIPNKESEELMLELVQNESATEEVRSEAIIALSFHGNSNCKVMLNLLADDSELIQESALNYLVNCENDPELMDKVGIAVAKNERLKRIWDNRNGQVHWDNKNSEQIAKELELGNPVRGKIIFGLQKSQCTNCHQVDGWGGSLGPDLSNIGSSKNSDLLISAIINPSAEISPEWQGWYLTTEDGKKVYGRQIDVGFNEVEIMNLNGEFETFKNVSDFGPSDSSLMPENLVDHLTKEEFIDLVAYLKTLK